MQTLQSCIDMYVSIVIMMPGTIGWEIYMRLVRQGTHVSMQALGVNVLDYI